MLLNAILLINYLGLDGSQIITFPCIFTAKMTNLSWLKRSSRGVFILMVRPPPLEPQIRSLAGILIPPSELLFGLEGVRAAPLAFH